MFLMTIVSLVAAITEAFHSKWSSRLGQVPVIALFFKKNCSNHLFFTIGC